jgi:hypothetical protein
MKTSTFIWHIGNVGFEAILFAVRFVGEGAWALGRVVLGGAPDVALDEPGPGEGRTYCGSIEPVVYDDERGPVGAISGSQVIL